VIFSRGRGSGGKHHRADDSRRSGRHAVPSRSAADDYDEVDTVEEEPVLADGPYDVTEAPEDEFERLDLGALKVPVVPGVEIRVQAGEDGTVQQVILVHGESALQLGVFAAPRTEGIWEETRAEIKSSLFDDGVAAEEVPGEYGTELRARVRTPEGLNDLRFVGIDGPRWMVRGIYQGRAAVDPAVAAPLVECLHRMVVDRGKEAMPVREALPLRLPREAVEQAQAQAAEQAGTPVVPPANGTEPRAPRPTPRPGGRGARKPSPRPRRSG
jgi:Protein of unknown function (DUF3710)